MVIDTVYDGEDLTGAGKLTCLGTDGVIAAHSYRIWTVAFRRFRTRVRYMAGENQMLEVPRRSSPRTAVPAGAVALAGNYSAAAGPRDQAVGDQVLAVAWAPSAPTVLSPSDS